MSIVDPDMEKLRQCAQEDLRKAQATRLEAAQNLVALCDETDVAWRELPAGARQRICRSVDTAPGERGFAGLAYLLGVDNVDARFFERQAAGQLTGPTELLLRDVEARDGAPLSAGRLLAFLLEHRLVRCLGEVACGVRDACARRRQAQLLRHASGGDSASSAESLMESGYLSSSGHELVVGTVAAPPDVPLLQAVPTGSTPPSEADSETGSEADCDPKAAARGLQVLALAEGLRPSPCLLLTYAADGRDTAHAVADRLKALGFRSLLLEEQRRWRLPDPYTAVQKWFHQVDYVVPLLTPEYLAATQNRARPADRLARRLAEDVRFVYSLMCTELEKNQHVNWRVRPVVPDALEDGLREHPLYGSPLFRWPFLVSDLEELAECLSV